MMDSSKMTASDEEMDIGSISDELSNLFQSFRFVSHGMSFAPSILNGISLDELVYEIRSLSNGVLLTKDNRKKTEDRPGVVHVLEIELNQEKEYEVRAFLKSKENNREKSILIFSKSVGMIDAKLSVYRKYKDDIDANGIFLLHEYDNFDELAKSIAYKRVSSKSKFVGTLIESFSKENLKRVVQRAIDISLTPEHITRLCYEVDIQYKRERVGSVYTRQYMCYSTFTVQAIKQILAEETLKETANSLGSRISNGVLKDIEREVQMNLSNELGNIRYQISDDIYIQIQNALIRMIISFFQHISDWIVNLVTLFVRVFYPVNVNSEIWRGQVANEIYEKILEKKEAITAHAIDLIHEICWSTAKNLELIHHNLEEFRSKCCPKDQQQLFAEWLKRDIVQDKNALKKHPSILKYMAGHRIDGRPVVKVFLRDDHDKDAQVAFKKACQGLEFAELEFVNIAEKSKEEQEKAEEIKKCERNAPALDKTTRTDLKRVIQEHARKIFATYSNVVGMRIGKVTCNGDKIENNPCIVLYCLDEDLIPFGEKQLPEKIGKWHCDSRKDYVMLGHCPDTCSASMQSLPDPGCSIGIPSVDSSGSVGFLVEPNYPTDKFRCGFLTASHVAVNRFTDLYRYNSLMSSNYLSQQIHPIVHPSWQDNDHVDYTIGEVVESFCGNYEHGDTGLDFALVRINESRKEERKEALPIVSQEDLNFDGETYVTKLGRTTMTTTGVLTDDSLAVKIFKSSSSEEYLEFLNCYAVENLMGNEKFFQPGDSGSGVFVIAKDKTLKPLGIAFAFQSSETAVCKINTVIDKLDMTIVRYHKSKQKATETGKEPENTKSELMECA